MIDEEFFEEAHTRYLELKNQYKMKEVLEEVFVECKGQLDKWGLQSHKDGTGPLRPSPMIWGDLDSVNYSEFANSTRKRTEEDFERGQGSWEHILTEEVFEAYAEEDEDALRAELVQVAAVAVSWINAIDRRKNDLQQ